MKTAATYNPLPWQVPAWRDKSPIMLLTGSAGGGKSRIAAEKLHGYLLKYPGATGIVGRKDKTAAGKSVVPFLLNTVMGDSTWGTFKKSDGLFQYNNGSQLWVVGFAGDDQREALKSVGKDGAVDVAWIEEANALTEDDHNLIITRMRGHAAKWTQIIYTTNPDYPLHWINKRLIIGKQASVYYSGAKDNPYNPPEYLASLDMLTGVMRSRMRDGLWVMAEGAVYNTFDKSYHVQRRDEADFKEWYLAQDEGYTNPAVILLVGVDSDGRLHVAREFYKRGVLQEKVVQVARDWAIEKNVSADYVDEAAAGLIADLRNNGVNAIGSKGRVLDGIQLVQNRLMIQGDGRPRLTIDPDCENIINEFESYVWKPEKDEPIKENDHALDALRYLCVKVESQLWYVT